MNGSELIEYIEKMLMVGGRKHSGNDILKEIERFTENDLIRYSLNIRNSDQKQ